MNLDRSLIFAYLEEDNIQRAYFRVQPLLSLDGNIHQEALQLWPNEGCLRVVPDRNEQHTFKIRMRKLGSYCVIDLRNQPVDAGKIRTNKNFKPDRGEVNQYIIYSDTIHEMPEHTFYQLIDGDAKEHKAIAADAITPLFYIREADTIYGPIRKDSAMMPEPAAETAGVIFEVACPDGITRTILCLENEPAESHPQPAEEQTQDSVHIVRSIERIDQPSTEDVSVNEDAAADKTDTPETLPIGQQLQILDAHSDHEETLKKLDLPVSEGANLLRQNNAEPLAVLNTAIKSEPLSGTPLVRTPLRVAAQQSKNHTQEIVSNQWSVGKYEPPAQNLPSGTAMRPVENPVQAACVALRNAWNADLSRDQLIDFMLSLDGLRSTMEIKLCDGQSVTVMQRVLRERLQDLEAERLTALCELDRAKKDVDAYKQELVSGIATRLARETNQLQTQKDTALAQLEAIKSELNALTLQRDGLLSRITELQNNTLPEAFARIAAEAQMTLPVSGIPLRISPISGHHEEAHQLIERVVRIFSDSACPIDRNAAIALIVLLAICPRIGIVSPSVAALSTLAHNVAVGMGWQSGYAHQYTSEQHLMIGARPVDSTPALVATNLPNYAPVAGATKLTLSRSIQSLTRNAAYDVNQWPIITLGALPFIPQLEANADAPICQASIEEFAGVQHVSEEALNTALLPILNAAIPLSGAAKKEMYKFVSICAGLMEGGLPVAADWGIMLWIIPGIERGSQTERAVKALLDEYPLSLAKL